MCRQTYNKEFNFFVMENLFKIEDEAEEEDDDDTEDGGAATRAVAYPSRFFLLLLLLYYFLFFLFFFFFFFFSLFLLLLFHHKLLILYIFFFFFLFIFKLKTTCVRSAPCFCLFIFTTRVFLFTIVLVENRIEAFSTLPYSPEFHFFFKNKAACDHVQRNFLAAQ